MGIRSLLRLLVSSLFCIQRACINASARDPPPGCANAGTAVLPAAAPSAPATFVAELSPVELACRPSATRRLSICHPLKPVFFYLRKELATSVTKFSRRRAWPCSLPSPAASHPIEPIRSARYVITSSSMKNSGAYTLPRVCPGASSIEFSAGGFPRQPWASAWRPRGVSRLRRDSLQPKRHSLRDPPFMLFREVNKETNSRKALCWFPSRRPIIEIE